MACHFGVVPGGIIRERSSKRIKVDIQAGSHVGAHAASRTIEASCHCLGMSEIMIGCGLEARRLNCGARGDLGHTLCRVSRKSSDAKQRIVNTCTAAIMAKSHAQKLQKLSGIPKKGTIIQNLWIKFC